MQPSTCANATVKLFRSNDTCSQIVQQSRNINGIIDEALFMGTCPARFQAYVTACLPNDTNVSTKSI